MNAHSFLLSVFIEVHGDDTEVSRIDAVVY